MADQSIHLKGIKMGEKIKKPVASPIVANKAKGENMGP
jgi:hypothetical protein